MPSYKNEKIAIHNINQAQAVIPKLIQERRTAAEETYQNVLNRLGKEGTYDVGGPSSGPATTATNIDDSAYKTSTGGQKYLGKSKIGNTVNTKVLDPAKATAQVENSSQFRTMSRLQAESEQMIAREGPLYDEMMRNTQLPIVEGSAAIARANAQALKEAAARGGSARRQAFEEVQKIRSQQELNSQRLVALSNNRMKIDEWARDNARTNLEFGQKWASNLGGIRESYQQAMDGAAQLMAEVTLPNILSGVKEGQALRAQVHAEKREKTAKWVSAVAAVASIAMGGAGAMMLAATAASAAANASASGHSAGGSAAAGAASGITNRMSGGGFLGGVRGMLQENSGSLIQAGIGLGSRTLLR